jgi:UDP-N-acetylmuramate--alanine ligase
MGLEELSALGATTYVGHAPGQVGEPDAVVVSSAIAGTNPEVVEARTRGLPVWARAQALAACASGRRTIAVAGTHGKTTTTSMIAVILERAGLDPTYLVGGDLNESGSGARAGGGDLFVVEADESDGSFLLIRPAIGIVTNIELDHVDFYPGGLEEIERAFTAFASSCEQIVAFGDDPSVRRAVAAAGTGAVTYGVGDANDIRLRIDELGPSGARGVLVSGGREIVLALPIDGEHNLLNAAAAVAAAGLAGVDPADAAAALSGFRGVHRRFELRGSARGAEFFDDYGHTPTEMAVTLEVARRRGPSRLIAVVQPHRYSRVEALWRELGASVTAADVVVVTDVYGAEQDPIPGVTGRLVADGALMASPGTRVVYLAHRSEVVEFLDREVRAGDLVITLGCGDVWMLADATLARLRDVDDPSRDAR